MKGPVSNANQPAYPFDCSNGLTKRELFAAMAMQGMISNYGALDEDNAAKYAVSFSDALLAELEAPQ